MSRTPGRYTQWQQMRRTRDRRTMRPAKGVWERERRERWGCTYWFGIDLRLEEEGLDPVSSGGVRGMMGLPMFKRVGSVS